MEGVEGYEIGDIVSVCPLYTPTGLFLTALSFDRND